jgi:lambda family phage portal protein
MSKLLIVEQFDVREHRPEPRKNAVRAKYDAAQTNTDNQNHWSLSDKLSADAGLSPTVRAVLRNRARYEIANNTYAAGMVRTLANDTIGTGPGLQCHSEDAAGNREIEYKFDEWCRTIKGYHKLHMMRMAKAGDGEGLGVFHYNLASRYPVKLDLKLYECDQLAAPAGSTSNLSDGIIFDDFGNPTGYSLLKNHPGSGLSGGGSEIIPADDVIFLAHLIRPGQTRGLPEITPALPLYAQLRRFTLAVLAAAETAADLAGVIQSAAGATDPDDIEALDTIDIVKRQLLTMPKGWNISQLKAEQPATTYEMFKRNIISEIARCLNMPYNVAAGDSSNYNYSSGRLDHKTYYKTIRVDRAAIETTACDRMLERWWREARLIKGYLTTSLRSEEFPPLHSWGWDGDESIDPVKEANHDDIRLMNHTTTLQEIYGKQNKDWEEQIRQRAKEVALMDELKLIRDLKPESFGDMNKAQPAGDQADAQQ